MTPTNADSGPNDNAGAPENSSPSPSTRAPTPIFDDANSSATATDTEIVQPSSPVDGVFEATSDTPTATTDSRAGDEGSWSLRNLAQNCASWIGTQLVGRTPTTSSVDTSHSVTSASTIASSADDGQESEVTTSTVNATEGKAESASAIPTPTVPDLPAVNGDQAGGSNNSMSSTSPSSTTPTSSSSSSASHQNNTPPAGNQPINHFAALNTGNHPAMQPAPLGHNLNGPNGLLPSPPPPAGIVLPAIPLSVAAPLLGPLLRLTPPLSQQMLPNDVCLELGARYTWAMELRRRDKRFRQMIHDENRRQSLERKARMEQERERRIEYSRRVKAMRQRTRRANGRNGQGSGAVVEANALPTALTEDEDGAAEEAASVSSSSSSGGQTEEETGAIANQTNEPTSPVSGQDSTLNGQPGPQSPSGETRTNNDGETTLVNERSPSSRGVKRAREEDEAEPTSSQDDNEKRPTRKARRFPSPEPEPF
ncbi:hypothetical protein BDN72DRAFT_958033 [Pluteus cervinus]|uniref:Uncharacterized protein n=1 Tax=Pluteus cervinus TaxID=181527 RepID=A0ACD3B0G5_9AGAR|nr:hypothetical protein BDN72DRAFT_958033 [Pluteus cervinus]